MFLKCITHPCLLNSVVNRAWPLLDDSLWTSITVQSPNTALPCCIWGPQGCSLCSQRLQTAVRLEFFFPPCHLPLLCYCQHVLTLCFSCVAFTLYTPAGWGPGSASSHPQSADTAAALPVGARGGVWTKYALFRALCFPHREQDPGYFQVPPL